MTENPRTSLLFFGATGYIGGAVLARLLDHPRANTFDITVYLRNPAKAKLLQEQIGVKAIVGSHHEQDKITPLAEAAHIVFQLADSDDVPLTEAILKGLKQRHAKSGDVPILIHTSGFGVVADNARGEFTSQAVYSDNDVEQLKSIPSTALHRNVELLVIDADIQGYARTYIFTPSIVYGIAKHSLAVAGVSNVQTIMIPVLIRAAIGRKRAGIVGKGKSMVATVHIDDCAELYIVLLEAILNEPEKTGHGWSGFYYSETGECSLYDLCKAIGDVLVDRGITSEAEPTPFTLEDFHEYFSFPGAGAESFADRESIGWYFGSNFRGRGERARAIGWKPKYTNEDMLKGIKAEVEALL